MENYYAQAFRKLMDAGVPRWYIRLYLLDTVAGDEIAFVSGTLMLRWTKAENVMVR